MIAILIGIFAACSAGETGGPVENAVESLAEPGQATATKTGGFFSGIAGYFGNVKSLRAENEELKRSNVELDKKVRDSEGLEEENERLRAMLDLTKTESKLDLLAAEVSAKDPSNWYSSFTINRGSEDGVQKNQPVFSANRELVGQVYKVGSHWAEVITILDPECGVGCKVERSGDIGVLEGDSSLRFQGKCRLGYLSRDTDIAVGDYLETSGLGGIYPKGLLIGRVTEVMEDNATMSKYATVEPLADLSRLSQVFVLKSHTEEIKKAEHSETEKKEEKTSGSDKEDSKSESNRSESRSEEKKSSATAKPTATAKPKATATAKPASRQSDSSGGSSGSGSSGSGKSESSNSGKTGGSSGSSGNSSTGSRSNSMTMDGSELSD